jgi:hypothetical protein
MEARQVGSSTGDFTDVKKMVLISNDMTSPQTLSYLGEGQGRGQEQKIIPI